MTVRRVVESVAVLLFAAFVAGCKGDGEGPGGPGGAGGPGGGHGPGGPGGAPPPPEVGVIVVKPERVTLTTELPGRTAPLLIAEVRPEVGGILQKRLFNEGSEVKAGDVLYEIDPTTYQAAVDSAAAALERAQAAVAIAGSRARRYDTLAGQNAISLQDKDDASGSVRLARADVGVAKALLAQAQIALDRAKIKAPISGRIGRSRVTVGALVAPFQPEALTSIQQLDPIYVDVTRSSVDGLKLKRALESGRLALGAAENNVKLVLEDGTPYPEAGKLAFADVTVDPTTGSVTLRAEFPNPKGDLLPGMYVRAFVSEGVSEGAILVPQQGVARNAKGQATALVVGPDGKVVPRTLEVDRTIGDQWLVTKGLAAGDQVIVEGTQKARPGATVKPAPASFLVEPNPGVPAKDAKDGDPADPAKDAAPKPDGAK